MTDIDRFTKQILCSFKTAKGREQSSNQDLLQCLSDLRNLNCLVQELYEYSQLANKQQVSYFEESTTLKYWARKLQRSKLNNTWTEKMFQMVRNHLERMVGISDIASHKLFGLVRRS